METRIASLYDAASLGRLHSECFGVGQWSARQIADSLTLSTTRAWIAGDNKSPQGFIMCQLVRDEAEILTFCVTPHARRCGIGRGLLNTLILDCRHEKARMIYLEVAADNPAALALYEQAGFGAVGRRAGYYARGAEKIDAILLELIL